MRSLVLAAALFACSPALAQSDYPGKPIRVIVPFTAGGVVDVIARTLGERMTQTMGQPVVVENRTGASGSIGTEAVAKAAPDGYTLLLASPSHTSNPSLMQGLAWHPTKSFAPVTMVGSIPNLILVHPSVPVSTLDEFVAYAKARPGKLSYSSAGAGSAINLAAEMLKSMAGIDVVHVPYRGQPEALTALLSGEVQMMPLTVALAAQRVKSGSVKALAITSPKRSPAFPDLPAVAERYPGYEVSTWFAYLAPAGTPEPVIAKLNREIQSAMRDPGVQPKLLALGTDLAPGTPQELAKFLEVDAERWAKVIRDAGIKAQ